MDAMLLSHLMFKKIQSSDFTCLEVKDWFNLCAGGDCCCGRAIRHADRLGYLR